MRLSFEKDVSRLWLAIQGRWEPDKSGSWDNVQPGRKSDHKGYFGEIGHAAKNVGVELLRDLGIYDRPTQSDGR